MNLGRIFVINLIIFVPCFCILFLYQTIVEYLCVCVMLHPNVRLATGPALLSLHVNKLNWTEQYYYQYTHEKLISYIFFFNNYNIIKALFRCDFLLSLLCSRLLFVICVFLLCSFAVSVIGLKAVLPAH